MDVTPAAVDRDLTGDEAYQRRLAMSRGNRPLSPSGDDQLQAQTQGAAADDIPGFNVSHDSHPPPKDETGEEAYLRRLAMSTMHRAQPPPQALSPPSQQQRRSASPPSLSFNPFAPPSVPPPPPPPGGPMSVAPSNDIDAKKKAAAAIAAKLGALAALAPQPTAEPSTSLPPTEEKG